MSAVAEVQAAFYCVADERYFLGAVGMINSLRAQGHDEPIIVLDCGLAGEQRERIATEATVVQMRSETPPWMLKTAAPADHLAETIVLIDADMIVTQPLGELIERASAGKVVAFEAGYERFVPEWGELLDLGPIRRGPYVSSGLVFLGGEAGRETLRLMNELQPRVERLVAGNSGTTSGDYAFFALDQDVLNAILSGPVHPGDLLALDHRLAPDLPFEGLKLSADGAGCAYPDGSEPYVVHNLELTPLPRLDRPGAKPWLERRPSSVYSRLLTRYLLGPNLAIEVPPGDVPPWLREGIAARFVRAPVDIRHRLRSYLRQHLPQRIVRRVDAGRRRRALGDR